MHVFDQRILGIIILFLLGILVTVKRIATGSIIDKPRGDLEDECRNVLTVYARPNPLSICYAILQSFTKGSEDAGRRR